MIMPAITLGDHLMPVFRGTKLQFVLEDAEDALMKAKDSLMAGLTLDEMIARMESAGIEHGFLIAAKNLLDRNPNPTETEVRYWLAGNLCRCTGYDKIVRAVMDTAAEMRGA